MAYFSTRSLTDCDELNRFTNMLTAIPSILGGAFVLASFVLIPKIRTASFGLILAMAMSDSLFSVAWLFPVPDDYTWQCRLQGWWIQFFPITSVYLSLLTAVHIFLLITRSKAKHLQTPMLLKLSGGLVTLSLLGSLVPLITDHYGLLDSGTNCWIALDEGGRDKQTGLAYRSILQDAGVWTICFINFVLYYKIFLYSRTLFQSNKKYAVSLSTSNNSTSSSSSTSGSLRDLSVFFISCVCLCLTYGYSSGSGGDKVMQVVLRLRWYPVIMFVSWSGLILLRLYQFYSTDIPCSLMMIAQNIFNLQGFWNSLVFASNSSVWQPWRKQLGWSIERPSGHGAVRMTSSSDYNSNSSCRIDSSGGELSNDHELVAMGARTVVSPMQEPAA